MSDGIITSPDVAAAIDEFVASLPPLPPEQGGLPTPSSPEASASAQPTTEAPAHGQGAEASAKEKPPEPKEDPRFARGFQRLAARERALDEREQALKAQVAELEARSTTGLANKFKEAPLRTLRELGLTKEQIAELGRAALGETIEGAPQQYRELAEKLRFKDQHEDIKSELESLKKTLADKDETAKREAYYADVRRQYQAELSQYVASPELSEHAPTVARLQAADPEETARRIMDVVSRDAQARLRRGVGGDPMTPQEAALALERELAPFAKAFAPPPAQATQNARVPDATARKTLSDGTTNPAPVSREAPDPEKDWEGWKKAKEQEWLAEMSRRASQ